MDNTIGVIGLGTVGSTTYDSLKESGVSVTGYDRITPENYEEILQYQILFLCSPTEYSETLKSYNITSLVNACTQLSTHQYSGLIVIKSDVEPESTYNLSKRFGLNMVHNPASVGASTGAASDIQKHIVIGITESCPSKQIESLIELYDQLYPQADISVCTSEESEMMKISLNSLNTIKARFLEELHTLCQKVNNVEYDTLQKLMSKDNSSPNKSSTDDEKALLEYMKYKSSEHLEG